MEVFGPRPHAKLSISMHPDHQDAADVIAFEDGHSNRSKPFQEAIEAEAEARWGKGWRQIVRARAAAIRDRETVEGWVPA